MIDQPTSPTGQDYSDASSSPRQRAIEAYEGARNRAADTVGEAPLLALAGGIAAGALIAALLPRTQSETRLVRPTARRVKTAATAAYQAARDTGAATLEDRGITRAKGEETIRSLLKGMTDAAKASADAALDAARKG